MGHGATVEALAAIGQGLRGIGNALARLEALLKEHDDRAAERQAELLEHLERLLLLAAPPVPPEPRTNRAMLALLGGLGLRRSR